MFVGVQVECAWAADLEVEVLDSGEAVEVSEGRAEVGVALVNGCGHAYVLLGSRDDLERAAARILAAARAAGERGGCAP